MQQTDNLNNKSQDTDPGNDVYRTPETSSASLVDLLIIIAHNKKRILINTFGTAIITALFTLTLPNIYTARTMIVPSDDDKNAMSAIMAQVGGLAGIAGGALGAKTTGDLYVTMLRSETVKDPIIERFKLKEAYETKYRTSAYKALDNNTVITLGKKDGVISVAVSDRDPKRAADIANAYVEELGKLAAGLNMTGAGKNREFYEKRIAEAKADLSKSEDALKNFQSKNKTISVPDQAKATIEGVAQLRAQLAIKEVELGALRRQFTDTSQEVRMVKSVVESLKRQITGLEGKNGGSSSIPNIGNIPQLGQDYLRLMRDFKIQEAILEMLTKQFEISQLNELKDVAPFQLLQSAKVPELKNKPSRAKIVLLMTFVVFTGSVLSVLLRQRLAQMSETEKNRWKSFRSLLAFSLKRKR